MHINHHTAPVTYSTVQSVPCNHHHPEMRSDWRRSRRRSSWRLVGGLSLGTVHSSTSGKAGRSAQIPINGSKRERASQGLLGPLEDRGDDPVRGGGESHVFSIL